MQEAMKLEVVTSEEFEAMEKNERFHYELIDGVVMMSPSPSVQHQIIETRLARFIGVLLDGTNCEPVAECDFKTATDLYRPDIMVLCEQNVDLPEIIVEILSPSTKRKDLITKTIKYEEAGIKEYWIVDPKGQTVTVHDFVGGTSEIYIVGDIIVSLAHPELNIVVAKIFV